MSPSPSERRLDPDELALLEEELDHLLASLEDLEREYASGDLDEVDHDALKDDYTVRAAEVLAAIEEQRSLLREAPPRRRGRTVAVTAGVLLFALVAGFGVARGSGQRGDGSISGGIGTLRADLARCRAASMQEPEAGVECFDELLADAPGNVEALTYQGWAHIRAGDVDAGSENLDRAVELDPDYPDARVFRAVVASRAGDHAAAAAEIDRFYRNDPSPGAIEVLRSQGLEREVFIRLLDEPTRACWLAAAAAGRTGGDEGGGAGEDGGDAAGAAQSFLTSLASCLDGVLGVDPDNVDALVSRTYAELASGTGDLATGVQLAERALAAGPDDPEALLMHASVAFADGRSDDAATDLAALERLPRPTISALIGGPEELARAVADQQGAATTTTEPRDRGSGPSVPNPGGG